MRWEQLRPALDEAVGKLRERERNIVLLRFFQDKSYPEIEAALGLGASTAHKQVERSLEKIRRYFARRGVTTTTALLATAIAAHAATAVPGSLGVRVTQASLAKAADAIGLSHFLREVFFMNIKNKLFTAGTIAAVLGGAAFWWLLEPVGEVPVRAKMTKKPTGAQTTLSTPISAAIIEAPKTAPISPRPDAATVVNSGLDPREDPRTAVKDMLRLLDTGDFATYITTYGTPDFVHGITQPPGMFQKFLENMQNRPLPAESMDALKRALASVQEATPNYINDDGQKHFAVFDLDPPIAGIQRLQFLQVDGLWYCLDAMPPYLGNK